MASYRSRLLLALCFLSAILFLLLKRELDQRDTDRAAKALKMATKAEYPRGVPDKFTPDGQVQQFAGNTIISRLWPKTPAPALYSALLRLHAALDQAEEPLRRLYALLPPSSWHMTVFEGVCDKARTGEGRWPPDLRRNAPLAKCTELFAGKLAEFPLDGNGDDNNNNNNNNNNNKETENGRPPYRLRITGYDPLVTGIGLHVEPATPAENARLRRLRDRLSERLGIRHPQHDSYGLHISVAYLLRHLDEAQRAALQALLDRHLDDVRGEFVLATPMFCTFEDMLRYDKVFFLGDHGKDLLTEQIN